MYFYRTAIGIDRVGGSVVIRILPKTTLPCGAAGPVGHRKTGHLR